MKLAKPIKRTEKKTDEKSLLYSVRTWHENTERKIVNYIAVHTDEETHTNLDSTGNGLLIRIAINPSSLVIAHSVLLNSALMDKYKLNKPSSEMVNFGWFIALF